MKKTHKIIMLPTEDASHLCKHIRTSGNELSYFQIPEKSHTWRPQHLYILSNDEIKEGDWHYHRDAAGDKHILLKGRDFEPNMKFCSKIIATTDPKLKVKVGLHSMDGTITEVSRSLPQIPQSLIEYYAKHQPEEVELEYEWIKRRRNQYKEDRKYELKIQNNEVVWVEPEEKVCINSCARGTLSHCKENGCEWLKPKETLYTREEVEKLTHDSYLAGALANAKGQDMGDYWKWKKKNL
jgi:hypothetical protein